MVPQAGFPLVSSPGFCSSFVSWLIPRCPATLYAALYYLPTGSYPLPPRTIPPRLQLVLTLPLRRPPQQRQPSSYAFYSYSYLKLHSLCQFTDRKTIQAAAAPLTAVQTGTQVPQ